MPRLSDEPVNQDDDVAEGDIYELRFCEAPECERPIPLNVRGNVLIIQGQKCTVCRSCYERSRH